MRNISAGAIGEEEEETVIFEPLDEPGYVPDPDRPGEIIPEEIPEPGLVPA